MTTWNVTDAQGMEVKSLDGLARVLGTDSVSAARHLLADPAATAAAPEDLVTEAKAASRPKPGGGTPPPISTGSFVSWNGGQGRVDMLVTSGKVPGVTDDVEGTDKTPAARVVVWENGKATGKKIAKSTATLKRIPPIRGGKKDLVSLVAAHEARVEAYGLPGYRKVEGKSAQTVYQRGAQAWPGPEVTTLTREEWALGRVERFVKAAAGLVGDAGNDGDLLHKDHPLARGHRSTAHPDSPAGRDAVDFDMSQVQSDLEALGLA